MVSCVSGQQTKKKKTTMVVDESRAFGFTLGKKIMAHVSGVWGLSEGRSSWARPWEKESLS